MHMALGISFPPIGDTIPSAIHWEIIRNLRRGGREHFREMVQASETSCILPTYMQLKYVELSQWGSISRSRIAVVD